MRDHRIAVGSSLKSKIGEFGFFLFQILEQTKIIEQKHIKQDYPLNHDLDKLNYYFSAYLNTIQSLKDACQTAMGVSYSWSEISPTYGSFIFYCRNAITHDGSHLINAGQGVKNYIVGPLRRIDNNGKVIKFDPPKEDVITLSCNLAREVLTSISNLLNNKGEEIPIPDEADFKKSIESSLENGFIPDDIKKMINANKENITSSFKNVEIDIVQQVLNAITSIESRLVHICT